MVPVKSSATQRMAADLERWFLAISGSRDGVWDWFPQTGELYLSDQSRDMVGLPSDDLASNGQQWMARVYKKDVPRIREAILAHWRGQTPQYTCEYRIRQMSGKYLWVLSRARATFDHEGRVVRMTGMHTNITQRVVLQENLQTRTQELNTILDISPDGFVAINTQGAVQYVSPAFERLVGLAQQELVHQPEAVFWGRLQGLCKAGTDLVATLEAHANSVVRTKPRGVRFVLTAPTQKVMEVTPHAGAGATIATLFHFRDVSWESEVERMKTEFLANAAHELRTPLASVHGFSEVLMTQSLDEPARAEFTGIIHRQSQHMTNLLNELLDLARIEARRGTDFVLRTQDMRSLVTDIVRSFKVPAGRNAPGCTLPKGALYARVDVAKIRQALLNVLSNAYKYSPEGGAVTVTLTSGTTEEDLVIVGVQDHGIGMDEAVRGRLFERFFRADTTGRVPGTGLGLSIVKEIVELHQGDVRVASEPGAGTLMSIRLPRVYPGLDSGVTVPATLD